MILELDEKDGTKYSEFDFVIFAPWWVWNIISPIFILEAKKEPLSALLPQDYLFSVIQKMSSHPFDMIPVVDPSKDGNVIGIVTNQSIINLLTETKTS